MANTIKSLSTAANAARTEIFGAQAKGMAGNTNTWTF